MFVVSLITSIAQNLPAESYTPLPFPRRDLSSGNTLYPHTEQSFLQELQYDLTFANLTSAKGGLITGFRCSLSYCVHDHATLFTGEVSNVYSQALLVHCTVNDVEMVIVNVYSHPHHSAEKLGEFLQLLANKLEMFGCPNILCCGDFNAVLDVFKDSITQSALLSRLSKVFNSFLESTELVDVFRTLNPTSHRVTHFIGSHNTGRWLDYF